MMSTSNGRGEQVSVSVAGPERSGGPSTDTSRPDPEVPEKAKRRQFSAEYKLGILEEASACQEPGTDRGVAAPRRVVFFAPVGMAARSARRVAEGANQATGT